MWQLLPSSECPSGGQRRKESIAQKFPNYWKPFDKWNSTQITWPIKSNNFSSIAAEDHASKVLWRRTAGSRAIQSCRSFFCDMTWLNTKNKTFVRGDICWWIFSKNCTTLFISRMFFYVQRITRLKNHFYSADKLLTSEGKELRRALFSLKQIFQEDKDLVHGFVALGGLNCLVRIGNEADQNYQNYILRALGQVTSSRKHKINKTHVWVTQIGILLLIDLIGSTKQWFLGVGNWCLVVKSKV